MATCTGDQYVENIERTECIGNSLVKINNNFKNLDVAVCETGNDIESLLTLINQLSSNMQNIGNYPYARFIETYSSGSKPANQTKGTVVQRIINSTQYAAEGGFATLASNTITINTSGKYRFVVSSQLPFANSVNRIAQILLKNGSTIVASSPENSMAYADYPSDINLSLETTLNLTSGATITVHSAISDPLYGGSGAPTTVTYRALGITDHPETFLTIEVWKIS